MRICERDVLISDTDKQQVQSTKRNCFLNIAICALRTKDYALAIEHATRTLKLDPVNVKAFFRRACAYMQSGQYDHAAADLLEGNSNILCHNK